MASYPPPCIRAARQRAKHRRNLLQRKDLLGRSEKDRFPRHAEHHRRRFVLGDRPSASTPYGQEALGSIPAHPREEAGRTVGAELLRQGSEENIDRRPAGVSFWILSEPELALAEHEVAVGRSHQHSPLSERRERIAIGRVGNADGALPIEPFGEGGREQLPDMDDQENGEREALGQPAQNLDEGCWPARGDPNRDGAQTGPPAAMPRSGRKQQVAVPWGQVGPADA